MASVGTSSRLPKPARREQLLDTAAEMLLAGMPITMEGLAARAGVSKALPYLHFENAEGVVLALTEREMARFASGIQDAVASNEPGEAQLRGIVTAYLDVIEERGAILIRLAAALSTTERPPDRRAVNFMSDLFQSSYGLDKRAARAAAAACYGSLNGLIDAWAYGEISRRSVEATLVNLTLHLVGR